MDNASGKAVVEGIWSDTATQETYNLTDTVSGTADTNDKLNITIIGDSDGVQRAGYQTTAIENVNLRYVDGNTGAQTNNTVDASGFAGMTKLAVRNSSVVNTTGADTLTINNIAKGVTLELANNSQKLDVTANYVSAATAGTDDTVSISAAGGDTGNVTIGTGFETVAVTTSAAASTFQSLSAGANAKTIKVTGDQDLTIANNLSTSNSALTTFDASGNSGAVNVTLTAGSKLTAKGGSGTADRLNLDVTSSVATGMAVSGFETVGLQATASAALDMSLISGATKVEQRGSTSNITGSTLTLNNAAAGTGIHLVGTGKNQAQYFNAITYNQKDAVSGTADSVAITLANRGVAVDSTNTANLGLITAAGIETVTLNVADFAKVDGSLTIANAKSLTLTGAADLDLAAFTGGSDLATIDAGAYTGKLTLGTLTSVRGDLTYTGSKGVDVVGNDTVAAGKTQTFNLGDGNDSFTLSDVSGKLVVNAGAGDDTINADLSSASIGTGTGQISLDGGDGTDSLVVTVAGSTESLSVADFKGIERILVKGDASSGTTDTITLNVSDGYKETVEITAVAKYVATSGGTEVHFAAASAGATVDLSHVSLLGSLGDNGGLYLDGNTGNETLTGATVATSIDGGAGNDTITGGAGADVLKGGAGADSFVYATVADSAASVAANTTVTFDTISDFTTGSDKINLAAINSTLTGGTATGITVTSLTTGTASLNDTTIANFAELKAAIEAANLLVASAPGAASSATGLQAYVIDLTGNTGALGTGKYLLVNDADTTMDSGDLFIQLTGTSTSPGAGDFTLA